MIQLFFLIHFLVFAYGSTECTKSGLSCETTSKLVACIKINNTFQREPVIICPKQCKASTCENNTDLDGRFKLKFVCKSGGTYPDPVNCKKYYQCTLRIGMYNFYDKTESECKQGYGYNIKTNDCDIKLTDNKCGNDTLIPLCKNPGDNGIVNGNSSLFFICQRYSRYRKNLYPFLRLCPNGSTYQNFECTQTGTTTTEASTTSSSTESSSTTETTASTATKTSADTQSNNATESTSESSTATESTQESSTLTEGSTGSSTDTQSSTATESTQGSSTSTENSTESSTDTQSSTAIESTSGPSTETESSTTSSTATSSATETTIGTSTATETSAATQSSTVTEHTQEPSTSSSSEA